MIFKVIYGLYTKEKYIKILENIDKRFGDIEPAIQGDKESEMKTFLDVYSRMAQIPYDEYATLEEGKEDKLLQITSRNLEGGLLDNKCVCRGYAEILRNVLAQKGIESKMIGGQNPENGSGHAWNQIKIGNQWFNTDLTWDRDDIIEKANQGERIGPEVLKTDDEFDHKEYSQYRLGKEEKCNVSITEVMPNYKFQESVPTAEKSEITTTINDSTNQKAQLLNNNVSQQDIGAQVQNMIQANQITAAEFADQARANEQIQQEQQIPPMQQDIGM